MNARLRLVRPICNHWQVLLSLFLDIFVTFYCIVSLSVNITSSRPRHNLQWHIYNHKLLQDFDKRLHRRLLLADGFVRPWPPSNTCFLGSTWFSPQTASRSFQPFLHIPLQRLPVIFNGAGRTTPTKKLPLPWDPSPFEYKVPWAHLSQHPKWHLDSPFFQGSWNWPTDSLTDSATPCVAIGWYR